MLMYRRVDKTENAGRCHVMLLCGCDHVCLYVPVFQATDDIPVHISEQILSEQHQEKMEKERQEWEKNLCKVGQ